LNLNIRKVEILLQALDCLITHHNEAGIELSQVGEIAELAKEIQEAPNKWQMPLGIDTPKSNAKEVGGLGQQKRV
jgi:hypothetical protein